MALQTFAGFGIMGMAFYAMTHIPAFQVGHARRHVERSESFDRFCQANGIRAPATIHKPYRAGGNIPYDRWETQEQADARVQKTIDERNEQFAALPELAQKRLQYSANVLWSMGEIGKQRAFGDPQELPDNDPGGYNSAHVINQAIREHVRKENASRAQQASQNSK